MALGEEAFEQLALQVGAGQFALDRARDHLATPADHRHRGARERRVAKEFFLRLAATVAEQLHLADVELDRAGGEALGDDEGELPVHVVAAEQHMVADGDARQDEPAGLLADRDEAEVAGAAAHVADQHHVADLHLLAPALALPVEPGVERGLRFLEECEVFEARRPRRLDGQLARRRVERRGHRQDDVLLLEAEVGLLAGHARVPRLGEVPEVQSRRLERRDAAVLLARAPGQDARPAIDARMAQPRLGRADEARLDLSALLAGVLAGGVVALRCPRQFEAARRHLARAREIQEGRQQRPILDDARLDDLGDGQDDGALGFALGRRRIDVGEGAVGRAQVDAHYIS